jgi:glyoxylase I family protein
MPIQYFDHAAIVVSNLETSIKFYTELLGFKIIKRLKFSDRELVLLQLGDNPSSKIELLQYSATNQNIKVSFDRTLLGLRHIAFHVDNIQDTFLALSSSGVRMLENPPFEQSNGVPIAFGYDPDGVLLEFTEI